MSLCPKAAGGKQTSPPSIRGAQPSHNVAFPGGSYLGAGELVQECSSGACAGALLPLLGSVPLAATRGGQAGLGKRVPSGGRTAGAPGASTALAWRSESCRCGMLGQEDYTCRVGA